jgi:hypothetical protein
MSEIDLFKPPPSDTQLDMLLTQEVLFTPPRAIIPLFVLGLIFVGCHFAVQRRSPAMTRGKSKGKERSQTSRCLKCGKRIPDNSLSCSKCGWTWGEADVAD